MQCTPIWAQRQIGYWLGSRLHALALVSLVLAALLGRPLESNLGWVACPPQVIGPPRAGRRRRQALRPRVDFRVNVRAGRKHWRHTWVRALARSELLAGLWMLSSRQMPEWVVVLPWVEWLMEEVVVAWPWLGRQAEMSFLRWSLGWLRWGSLWGLGGDAARRWLGQWVKGAIPGLTAGQA